MTNHTSTLTMVREALKLTAWYDIQPGVSCDYNLIADLNEKFKQQREALADFDTLLEAANAAPKFEACSSELSLGAEDASFLVEYSVYHDQYCLRSVDPEYFKAHTVRSRLLFEATKPVGGE